MSARPAALSGRAPLLLGAAALLAGLVILDRAGAAEADDPGSTLEEVHARQASMLAEARARLDSAEAWEEALADARTNLRAASERTLHARTAQLAEARLRDRISDGMDRLGLTLTSTPLTPPRVPLEGAPFRIITLNLLFEAPNPAPAYQLIHWLESLTDITLRVARVSIDGPGRSAITGLDVRLTVEALARVGDPPRPDAGDPIHAAPTEPAR